MVLGIIVGFVMPAWDLGSQQIPLETILGVYISVNTLADMGATCVNVLGDLACATAMKDTVDRIKA